ncbi:hypothetical protein OF117_06530 [Geodermatophilus sp. YIM 151500]|uniref:hypothetical protein n=1 Tax=Geodermatophilus sp. YIM 151500 TaxID=2984531 RepID=UPI0021E48276|nr:hypothetical protein [Geodermatophilus sp. YIM 151500]MCV2489014.1 hypothetical protein [Geodermatophilus sp. YIM 151500]
MSRRRVPARALAAWLTTLLAVLLGAAPARAADTADGQYAADRVVVVGVPGLSWTDLAPDRTPELWALAEDAPIGALSVRAARSITCPLDGWATLGAGNRARYPGPEEPLPTVPVPTVPLPDESLPGESLPEGTGPGRSPSEATSPDAVAPGGTGDGTGPAAEEPVRDLPSLCDLQQRISTLALVDPAGTVRRIAEDEGTVRFGARPAALGAAVGCAGVAGRAATLAVAAAGVQPAVADELPADDGALTGLLGGCPLSVLSLDGLFETADVDPAAPPPDPGADTVPDARAAALAGVDAAVGRVRAAAGRLPGETLLLVQGVSEVDDARPQLHVGIASGPGFEQRGWLTSSSTGRAPFVQLIDVAPTALRALGIEAPSSMNGQPMQRTGGRPALAEAVAELEEAGTAARVHYRSTGILFWTLVVALAVVVALGVAVLGLRPRTVRASRGRLRPVLRTATLAVAALPGATYLAGLVPWAAAGAPRPALLAAVLAADAAVVALALLGPWRATRLGPPLAVLAVTAGTLVGDVLTGSTLELDGLLGYDAIVAGRFTGYGNLTFGLLSVSVLLLTAAAAAAAGRRAPAGRGRAAVLGTVAAIGVLTVAVVGTPALGRDFGGVLAALPGFALLAMLLGRIRVTVPRLVGVIGAAVVTVGAVALLDWRRPPAERSHLGRFVDQVLSGEAWTVVLRKAQANLDILLGSPLVWTLPTALFAAWWLAGPGGLLRSRAPAGGVGGRAGLAPGDAEVLRAGLLAVALSLAIGAAVNDSGVAVPATAAALLVPLLVWLAAGRGSDAEGRTAPGGTPRSGPVEDGDRVTVVSRGSTVWNA